VIDECSGCGGVFIDHVAVDLVVSDHAHERAEALLAALRHAPHSPLPPAGGRMYVKCPTCSVPMNRKQSASGARVVVDVCKAHGTFFDPGELPAIIAFVKSGGAPKPQPRPSERKSQVASSSTDVGDVADAGSALVELFVLLFD
jgi:Zn-finger nucleic acid-binding protein